MATELASIRTEKREAAKKNQNTYNHIMKWEDPSKK